MQFLQELKMQKENQGSSTGTKWIQSKGEIIQSLNQGSSTGTKWIQSKG